jgi:hypothetical protein
VIAPIINSSSNMQWPQHPIAYFVAGLLVPTISYFFLARTGGKNDTVKITQSHDDVDDYDSDSDSADDNDASPLVDGGSRSASWSIRDAPYKMVFCVNTSLGMTKGELRRSALTLKHSRPNMLHFAQ